MEVGMRIHIENRGRDGIHEERPKFVPDVDAVIPQMWFADESPGEADSRFPTYRKGGIVVWVYVMFE